MSSRFYSQRAPRPIELWGGIECTLNRVGDTYFDQYAWSGHDARPGDLERIAALGIRTLRYGILWEKTARGEGDYDWSWADERLRILREVGITPIVGFLHHGSGPRFTDLLDPHFPEKLAAYARAFARRFPEIELYTPVNEPLTTARFCGLYGHWFPHQRDDAAFARTLLHQCRAIALAMREIRRINPRAQLIQTDDLSRVWSTPALAYQADFENERRWLAYDLLVGSVGPRHSLWEYLLGCGLRERELMEFCDAPCPPAVVGLDYYATSERFLDERLELYPRETHGSNGRDFYADVAAVRVMESEIAGPGAALLEATQRFDLPVAQTEAFLGCTPDEQARWLWEAWRQAHAAQCCGADVRAVCAWSLLGAHNWHNLVTRNDDHYEPSAFEVREGQLYPTLLGELIRELANGRTPQLPELQTPGWWRREERFLYPPVEASQTPSGALLETNTIGALQPEFSSGFSMAATCS
jgi:dTDP-4-dehydrorhamnose reductase